jgi:hypothetical protein
MKSAYLKLYQRLHKKEKECVDMKQVIARLEKEN